MKICFKSAVSLVKVFLGPKVVVFIINHDKPYYTLLTLVASGNSKINQTLLAY